MTLLNKRRVKKGLNVYCINMHCHKSIDIRFAVKGDILGDYYCSLDCQKEDKLRNKAGLNEDGKWKIKTYLDKSGQLRIKE